MTKVRGDSSAFRRLPRLRTVRRRPPRSRRSLALDDGCIDPLRPLNQEEPERRRDQGGMGGSESSRCSPMGPEGGGGPFSSSLEGPPLLRLRLPCFVHATERKGVVRGSRIGEGWFGELGHVPVLTDA